MNDLNRNCLKSGHWVILHDTQYDTPQSFGQLGRGISYSYIIYSFMFHILQNQKMTTHKTQALKKTFFLTSWGRKKKRGQASLNFTHSFHALITKAAHTKFTIIVDFVIFIRRGENTFSRDIVCFSKRKSKWGSTPLNNCLLLSQSSTLMIDNISIIYTGHLCSSKQKTGGGARENTVGGEKTRMKIQNRQTREDFRVWMSI
jgi:hypothetical protein